MRQFKSKRAFSRLTVGLFASSVIAFLFSLLITTRAAIAQEVSGQSSVVATSGVPTTSGGAAKKSSKKNQLAKIRVPGEFESQRAILLSVSDWQPHHFPILTQVVEATARHVNLIILYNDKEQLTIAAKELAKSGKPHKHVFFSQLDLNTIWLRDFGPRIAETNAGSISVDFYYEGTRPKDDSFPRKWATLSGTRLRTVHWTLQGGNLITNGNGIGFTTNRIFKDNFIQFPNSPGIDARSEARKMVTNDFKRAFNLDQLVVLEPLEYESTKHVDMFLTVLDRNRVLVAQVDQYRDPTNAVILSRNVARLRTVKVDGKPLEVHRIRLPMREGDFWCPFTNIMIANKLILMPTYDSIDPRVVAGAVATYKQLLPDYEIKTIDMTTMKSLQGSLHCFSLNLPAFAPWPKQYYTFENVVAKLP